VVVRDAGQNVDIAIPGLFFLKETLNESSDHGGLLSLNADRIDLMYAV
jgi:hypothetical protein